MRIIDDEAMEDQTKPSTGVERDNKIGETGDSIRWTAPELMDPDGFGYTKYLVTKLPSKSTDIYALGMTILEVSVHFSTTLVSTNLACLPPLQILTGRQPFGRASDGTIVRKVTEGVRPERPKSGFSDGLWSLLQLSWSEEYESRESKRPPMDLILDQLQKDSSGWFSARLPFPTVESKRSSFSEWISVIYPFVRERES